MAKSKVEDNKDGGRKVVSLNRKARFDYEILEKFEAGIVLKGPEIKSIRLHGISIGESYVRPQNDEIFLLNAHITPYEFNKNEEIDPARPRKLLMHRNEIDKLRGRVEQKGLTIVPLQVFFLRGRAKIELALARGKASPDKRQSIKAKEADRQMARALRRG